MRFAASLALAISLAAISAMAQPKPPLDPSLSTSDTTLLQDEDKATAELQRRLRDQVRYRNGLLIITDRGSTGVTVMPATIIWGVDCGDTGLSVTFGSGGGDTDNGLVLQLTSVAISDDKCMRIALAIGETVLAITKGN